jgi:hypothetical protein
MPRSSVSLSSTFPLLKRSTVYKIKHSGKENYEVETSYFVLSCFTPGGLGCYMETV